MDACDKFSEILAAGGDAPAEDQSWARGHARACDRCGELARAFTAFEARAARAEEAPAGFADRVLSRLGAEKRRAAAWAGRPRLARAWALGGAGLLGAAVVAFVLWLATPDATYLSDAASVLESRSGGLTLSAGGFANVLGAACAAAAALGAFGYYYLVPRR